MRTLPRVVVATAILALLTTVASALPYGAQITRIQDDAELRFRVTAYALEGAVDPPDTYRVVRRNTAPGMMGPSTFTVWLPFPPNGETYEGTYLDPQVVGLDTGQYEVIGHWSATGREEILDSEWLALVEHPYLLRGTLLSETDLEPCLGGGLLECVEVVLENIDWWHDHGPDVLLDIYGRPVRLDGRDDCRVHVTWVEPMPVGSECGDPMATDARTWSTVRSLYD